MKKRILIVDDDIMTLKILKKYLEEEFEVVTENAGYRFVEKMESYGADLILLDIEMPIVNGLQAFSEMMKNPKMQDVPVAFLSGVSNPELVRDVLLKGAAGYIIKTTPKQELIERVNKIFEKAAKRQTAMEVMIMHEDMVVVKTMRDTLLGAGYKVKIVKNMVDAADYITIHKPGVFVIGYDSAGTTPSQVKEALLDVMRENHVAPVLMEKQFFSKELLDNVILALGES